MVPIWSLFSEIGPYFQKHHGGRFYYSATRDICGPSVRRKGQSRGIFVPIVPIGPYFFEFCEKMVPI